MGILRTDRVSGLGGANAIKGSVFFGTFGSATYGNQIEIQKDTELDIGNGNLTVECWFNSGRISGYQSILGQEYYNNFTSNKVSFNFYLNNDGIYLWNRESGSATQKFGVTGLWVASTWNHVAWVREGTGSNENKIYLNGSLVGSAFTNDVTYSSEQKYHIGGNFYSQTAFGQYPFSGHISNLRMSNIARYTANFTPPTSEFAVDSNTIILTCQSPSNILKEETGKTLSNNTVANNNPPMASRFTPNSPVGFSTTTDVGTQFGSTFGGVTTFDSQAYMVPPGGNTRERNRGRGIIAAGGAVSPYKDIQVIDIASSGIAQDFGDLLNTAQLSGSASSSTRMLVAAGYIAPTQSNVIEFITIANIASSTDFGDLTQARRRPQGLSNSTRGVFVGGNAPPTAGVNTIDFVTIATAGNASDFGDTNNSLASSGGAIASSTRGVYTIGGTPAYTNIVEFITIATTGNGQDFGDLVGGGRVTLTNTAMSPTRGILAGGVASPVGDPTSFVNTIEFVTMASLGNSVNFGDLQKSGGRSNGNCSSSTRGVFNIGTQSPADGNTLEFVTIATTGDAIDFGDLSGGMQMRGACSNKTRGLFAGGFVAPGSANYVNTCEKITITTTGNATDWGDVFEGSNRAYNSGISDSHGGLS